MVTSPRSSVHSLEPRGSSISRSKAICIESSQKRNTGYFAETETPSHAASNVHALTSLKPSAVHAPITINASNGCSCNAFSQGHLCQRRAQYRSPGKFQVTPKGKKQTRRYAHYVRLYSRAYHQRRKRVERGHSPRRNGIHVDRLAYMGRRHG